MNEMLTGLIVGLLAGFLAGEYYIIWKAERRREEREKDGFK